jgi:hypothetical protein
MHTAHCATAPSLTVVAKSEQIMFAWCASSSSSPPPPPPPPSPSGSSE